MRERPLTFRSFVSFGWVNASYVYGLQIVNSHMKRALGAVTSWDTFKKMTEGGDDLPAVLPEPAAVHVSTHVHDTANGIGNGPHHPKDPPHSHHSHGHQG